MSQPVLAWVAHGSDRTTVRKKHFCNIVLDIESNRVICSESAEAGDTGFVEPRHFRRRVKSASVTHTRKRVEEFNEDQRIPAQRPQSAIHDTRKDSPSSTRRNVSTRARSPPTSGRTSPAYGRTIRSAGAMRTPINSGLVRTGLTFQHNRHFINNGTAGDCSCLNYDNIHQNLFHQNERQSTAVKSKRVRPQTAPATRKEYTLLLKTNTLLRNVQPHFCSFVQKTPLHLREQDEYVQPFSYGGRKTFVTKDTPIDNSKSKWSNNAKAAPSTPAKRRTVKPRHSFDILLQTSPLRSTGETDPHSSAMGKNKKVRSGDDDSLLNNYDPSSDANKRTDQDSANYKGRTDGNDKGGTNLKDGESTDSKTGKRGKNARDKGSNSASKKTSKFTDEFGNKQGTDLDYGFGKNGRKNKNDALLVTPVVEMTEPTPEPTDGNEPDDESSIIGESLGPTPSPRPTASRLLLDRFGDSRLRSSRRRTPRGARPDSTLGSKSSVDGDDRPTMKQTDSALHDAALKKLIQYTTGHSLMQGGRLALSKQASRFELPMDMLTLETLTPQDYLKKYCIISSRRQTLYQKIFQKNKEPKKTTLQMKELVKALKDVLTDTLDDTMLSLVLEMTNVDDETSIDQKLFAGLAALAERMLYAKFVTEDTADLTDHQKEKIECADFFALEWKCHGVNVNPHMERLLRSL